MMIILNLEKLYQMLFNDPIRIIELSSTGGTHEFSLINPKIEIIKNNNLVFGVGHSSLENFEFKIFYDQNFKNEFVSTGTTNTFPSFWSWNSWCYFNCNSYSQLNYMMIILIFYIIMYKKVDI